MPYQTGKFPVYLDGQSVGSVTVFQNGLMTVFDSTCDNKSSDVLRLSGVSGGRTAALGVMIPDKAGTLRLKKSFSKNALTNLGLPDSATFYLLRPGELGADAAPAPPIEPQTSPAADNQAADSNPPADNQAIASSGDNSGTVSPAAKENAASPAADNRPAAQAPVRQVRRPPDGQRMPPFMMPSSNQRSPIQAQPNNIQPQPKTPAQPQAQAQADVSNTPNANAGTQAAGQAEQAATSDNASGEADDAKPNLEGWSPTDNPSALFGDPDFAGICRGVKDALTKPSGDLTLLAVPSSKDEPFPMMPVFCFGDSGRIAGREYIIFKIKNGKLAL